jgi:hypothetical protein
MTQLDTRFLTVHPRTALWWKQREKCAKCAAVQIQPVNKAGYGGGWLCGSLPLGGLGNTKKLSGCMSARDKGQPCGPRAALFVPKETA